MTVLFCDLVGSTPLSQQLDAEEWRDLIARYQAEATSAVARFEGHVGKKLGDGLLIYFGWPTARGDDPERAARAGLSILEALAPLNATLAAEGAPPLSVRIGMHTGPVVIADGGEVFGETANVAARVQGAAAPNTIVMTQATQRLVAGMFVVEDLGPRELKGVNGAVTLYRVVAPSPIRSRLDAAGRLTPFVGREVELATLVDRWERAREGDGENVLIVGEAGVGKSRLVYELQRQLSALPHTWLQCGATPYTEGTPFHPAISLVVQALGLAPEDTGPRKLARIERGLGALASAEAVALLADFVGIPPPTPLAMSRDLQRRKTMDLLTQWCLATSETRPLIIFVEDLHWCDASSLELIVRTTAQIATARIFIIATARPEFTPPWPARENATTLQLARLTKRQSHEMIDTLSGGELPAQTLDVLLNRAGGVPLYLEELTKAMAISGTQPGVDAIPATLADSLMARLDRLSTAKEVAQRAAVLGREFSYPLLLAVAGLEEAVLRAGLARLVEAEILFVRGEPPEAIYMFKHALVQEAAYESLLKRARQKLHARVVDVFAERFADRAQAEPEFVARHAEAGGRVEVAVLLYGRAGIEARAGSAHAEGIRHLRRALALLATLPEGRDRDAWEGGLLLVLGGMLVAGGGFSHPESQAVYERARALCERSGDTRGLGLALASLSLYHTARGEVARGEELANRILGGSEDGADIELILRRNLHAGIAQHYMGEFSSSLARCESAIALYASRSSGEPMLLISDPRVAGLTFAAWNLVTLGWPDRALARAREATRFAHQLGHPMSVCQALFFETYVHWLRSEWEAQRSMAGETIKLSEAMELPFWLGLSRLWHVAARVRGGVSGALADIEAALALSSNRGTRAGLPAVLVLLAEAHHDAGKPAEARGMVETGLAIAAETEQHFFDAELHRLRAEIVLAAGRAAGEAEADFQRALDVARAQEARSFELRAAMSLARLWRDQGKRAEARDLLAPVYAWFTEGLDTGDLVAAKTLLDELA